MLDMEAHYLQFWEKHAIIEEAGLDDDLFKKNFTNIATKCENRI